MNQGNKTTDTRMLGIFALVMITITSVDSIRNLPATALFGSPLIFFFIAASLFFLLPSALVSAELASTWREAGGVYVYVREAFGKKYGFLAIWFQWIENVIWYPTILSFIAGTMAYLIDPALASNKVYLVSVIVSLFWLLTFVNLAGIQTSALFSAICGIAGLLIPMALIIFLGATWVINGHPLEITFNLPAMLPDFGNPSLLVSMTAVVLCFCGMEIATAHTQNVQNPQRAYPIALLLSVGIIFVTMLLGSLAIAVIVPHQELSLVAGIMQAFSAFFNAYGLTWMIPLTALFIIVGSLGGVSNWIIAPTRSLRIALREAEVAPFLQRENSKSMPASLLIYQAIFVTLLSSLFLFMPSINSSYWILTTLTAQLYMGMYILMFAAAIYLRFKQPHYPRPFQIPGGKLGMILVAGTGIMASVFTVLIGFYPPFEMDIGDTSNYQWILFSLLVVMSSPPFILYGLKEAKAKRLAMITTPASK